MTDNIIRIAMWSGPRNISTTLMRSWESRGDTFVTDEPFYAYYLLSTGRDHPGKEEVIASQETDWRLVADWLTDSPQNEYSVWYQKHMAQHFLPGWRKNGPLVLSTVFSSGNREKCSSLIQLKEGMYHCLKSATVSSWNCLNTRKK